jgi:molecular chaperone GrpE
MALPQDDRDETTRPAGPVTEEDSLTHPSGSSPSVPPAGEDDRGSAFAGEEVAEDLDALRTEAEAKRDEYLELARRTQADFENYRKRMAAEVRAAGLRGKAEVVRELIPVMDHFELALQHSGIDSIEDLAKSDDPTKAGWAMTLRDLDNVFSRVGVEAVDPKGDKFDPTAHEALSTTAVEGVDSGVVIEVMQKGYRFEDHLIRPARVVVSG